MNKQAIPITLLVFFFGMLGYSLTIVVFTPLFLSNQASLFNTHFALASRTMLLGVILFLYPFGQFCSSPPLGALIDRYGRRVFLIATVGCMAVAYAGIALALKFASLPWLAVSLFVAGLAGGNVVIAFSVIADLVVREKRNQFFGYVYLVRALGFVIGPLLGGKLTDAQIVTWFNPSLPFWVVCILLGCTFIWVCIGFPETLMSEMREKIRFFQAFSNIRNIFAYRHLRIFFLVNFLVYMGVYGIFRTFPMYLVIQFDVGIAKLSDFVAFMSLPIVLINLFLTAYISKRFPSQMLLVSAAFFSAISTIAALFPTILSELWIFVFCVGIGFALCLPATNTLLSAAVGQKEQGRMLGNNQSLQVFAEAFSALMGGVIASIFIELSLVVFSLCLAAAALIMFSKGLRNTVLARANSNLHQ